MTSVSERLPPSFRMPPPLSARPRTIASPESATDPPSMSNTPLLPSEAIVRSLAPGPMIVVVAGLVITSGPPLIWIVLGLAPEPVGSRRMVSGPGWLLAKAIAARRPPGR